MSSDAFPSGLDLPAIDERLVAPGTRYEMWDGELVYVSPADPPHGTRQLQLSALIEAHTGPEFEGAAELLTRTSKIDDIAPDVSVYPDGPDPRTGGRQLEHLAFEIVSTQSLDQAGRKAAKLIGRGVRRVFAIDVKRSRALEWSAALGTWHVLDSDGRIDDPALAVPLPIEALIRNAKADDAVARALVARNNPVVLQNRAEGKAEGRAEGLAEGKAEGRAEGKAEAVIVLLTARGIALDAATRERLLGERDVQQLDRWIVRAASCATLADLLADA
jgi:Uma2 family endonuclease